MTIRPAVALAATLLLGAGCGGGGGGDAGTAVDTVPTSAPLATATPAPSGPPTVLAIVSPATGAEVGGNVVRLDVTSSGIVIVAADGDTSGRSGHYHVFVDREAVQPGEVIPVEAGIIHTTDDPIVITGLPVGAHRLVVVYGDGTHRRLGFTEASTSFTLAGPSIDAATPPNAPAGQPVVVTVAHASLPADTSLYVLVDKGPPASGQPIPDEPGVVQSAATAAGETTIAIPDLAPGTHVLWVVAAAADRTPIDPAVMDRVSVTVG